MKAVVISGGNPLSRENALSYLKETDFVVCADKGIEYALSYGVNPDLAVGDMDSVDSAALLKIDKSKIILSSAEKDFTDTHLAVIKAIEAGADDISIICATGLRSDHSMANIRLLLIIDEAGAHGRIADDENIITLCTDKTIFKDKTGTTVSLLALSDDTRGIALDGFKYPLDNVSAGLAWTTGISNVIISSKAEITLESGKLLVFEILT